MYQKKTKPQYVCTRVSLNQKQTSYRLVVAESYIMNIVFWYAVNRVFYGFDAIRFCSSMSICNYIVFFVAIKNIFVLIKIVYCYRFYSISVQIYITHAVHSLSPVSPLYYKGIASPQSCTYPKAPLCKGSCRVSD